MSKSTFDMFMHAVDDSILEEAQQPYDGRILRIRTVRTIAAVLACVMLGGIALWQPWRNNSGNNEAAVDLLQLGYSMAIPTDAENVTYSVVDMGEDYEVPMAQTEFTQNGVQYTYRALKTQYPEDISGVTEDWDDNMQWRAGNLDMQLCQSDETAYIGWYSQETGTQWGLSADESTVELMDAARSIIETLGYDMGKTPEGAENVKYNAFHQDELVVGETTFTLNGINYSYRIASTGEIEEDFDDISGTDDNYEYSARAELGWCSARIYYNEDGAGKLVWFDVVPGLLYSLTMDSGASEQAIMDMAAELYTPAQNEVG